MSEKSTVAALGRAGLVGAVAAEWTKLWTIRSTWFCLVAAVALGALYPVIVGVTMRAQHTAGVVDPLVIPAPSAAGSGILIMGQLALLTLATLTIAGEYATRSIQPTLQCVPGRWRLLLAKGIVLAPVLAVAGALVAVVGTAVAWLAMGSSALPVAAGDVVRLAAGSAAYLGLAGLLVVGLGAVVRSVAGTIGVALLLVLLVPMLLDQSGNEVLGTVAAGMPGSAGQVLIAGGGTLPYGPVGALVVITGWAVAAQLGAAVLMRTRDG